MLAGQVINFGDAIAISITGMAIVMLELAILAVFIQVMSKILATIVKEKEEPKKAAAPAPKAAPAPAAPAAPAAQPAVQGFMSSDEEDDLAVIMATVLEESGLPMEQVVFQSIVRVQ